MQQSYLLGVPKFSHDTLDLMAKKMRELSDIQSVLVFPATHSDRESAIFLLVTTDVQTREDFIERVQDKQRDHRYNSFLVTQLRFLTFCDCWSEFAYWVRAVDARRLTPQMHIDIVVVTPDWKSILPQLELAYYSEVPMFLHRLVGKDPLFVA